MCNLIIDNSAKCKHGIAFSDDWKKKIVYRIDSVYWIVTPPHTTGGFNLSQSYHHLHIRHFCNCLYSVRFILSLSLFLSLEQIFCAYQIYFIKRQITSKNICIYNFSRWIFFSVINLMCSIFEIGTYFIWNDWEMNWSDPIRSDQNDALYGVVDAYNTKHSHWLTFYALFKWLNDGNRFDIVSLRIILIRLCQICCQTKIKCCTKVGVQFAWIDY